MRNCYKGLLATINPLGLTHQMLVRGYLYEVCLWSTISLTSADPPHPLAVDTAPPKLCVVKPFGSCLDIQLSGGANYFPFLRDLKF